jgi:hypothetical protein
MPLNIRSINGVSIANDGTATIGGGATYAQDAAASAAQAALYDGPVLNDVAALVADTALTYTAGQPSTVTVGSFVRTRAEGFAYEVLASGATTQDLTTAGGVKLRVIGPADLRAFGAVGDWNGTTGTDNSAAIAREQTRIFGVGGATRRSSIIVGATSGTALIIQARSCEMRGWHLGSANARYAAGNPTTTGGVTDGHGFLIGGNGIDFLSRSICEDFFVEGHPTDGIIVASSIEMSGWENVTVIDCLRHGYAIGDGQVVAGFASSTRGSFHCEAHNIRAFECGGHALYMPFSGDVPVHVRFNNFQALGCLWKVEHDQSGSLRQIFAGGQGIIFDRVDIEDQQYANSTTASGRDRVALANPSRGMQIGSRGYLLNPYLSSLRAGIFAAVPGVTVIEPRSFQGTYATDMAELIEFTSASSGCVARVTSSLNAATQLVKNQSLTSDITIDGVKYFPTSLSTGDIAITRTPVDAQIVGGTIPQAVVTATTLRVLERDRTPTGADAAGRMFANASMDGIVIDLLAQAATTITITNGTAASGDNKGFVLGADRVLTGNKRLRVQYDHALGAWYQIAFFE